MREDLVYKVRGMPSDEAGVAAAFDEQQSRTLSMLVSELRGSWRSDIIQQHANGRKLDAVVAQLQSHIDVLELTIDKLTERISQLEFVNQKMFKDRSRNRRRVRDGSE